MIELRKLNLGCGLIAPAGWVNIDSSMQARLSKYPFIYKILCKLGDIEDVSWPINIKILDITKGLPFPDGSVAAIYSSHLIEHLTLEEATFVLGECYRVLCRNGLIRIITPDLFEISKEYVEKTVDDPKSEHARNFIEALRITDKPYRGLTKLLYKVFSRSKHLYMFDQWSLFELLENRGFLYIQRMEYGHSRIPDIESVERAKEREFSMCMEGMKG